MLVYISLYKGVTFFSKEMKLELEKDEKKLPIQLWSVDMTWEVIDTTFSDLIGTLPPRLEFC